MYFLALGTMLGLMAVAIPGPVMLTLVDISARHGRRTGARAGAAVAAADLFLGIASLVLVTAGVAASPGLGEALRNVSALTLLALGVPLLVRPVVLQGITSNATRPARTMFGVATLVPSAFAAWVALLAAMPFSTDTSALAAFVAGMVLASLAWHAALGSAAGTVGDRLTPSTLTAMTRCGGFTMCALAAWAFFS